MDSKRGGYRGLVAGGIGTVVLAAGITGLSLVELARAQEKVRETVLTAEESTYLIGEIGRQLSRGRSFVLEASTEGAGSAPAARVKVKLSTDRLDRNIDRLPQLLTRPERELWKEMETDVLEYRQLLDRALVHVEGGDSAAAERTLNELVPVAEGVQDSIDRLVLVNRSVGLRELESADARLSNVLKFDTALAALLVAGLAAIWSAVFRTVRRQREELNEYLARIESANRDLDAFAGRIAHDMRNVLSPVLLAASRLRHEGNGNDIVADQLERTATRGARLIEGLLAFSRAEAAHDHPSRTPLGQGVKEALDEHRREIDRIGVEVKVELPRDEVGIDIPAGLLHVVLSNVVGNAVKFLDGCEIRRIRIHAECGESCRVDVEDTGPGIPAEAVGRLFDPFFRAPGTRASGTGLGLATVRRVLEAKGGNVSVESEPGKGSTFHLELPLAREDRRASEPHDMRSPIREQPTP